MFKILSTLLIATSLFAKLDVGEVVQKKPFHLYTKEEAKISFLISDYAFITGDSEQNFDKYLSKAVKNKEWQRAQNAFYREFRSLPKAPQGIPADLVQGRSVANWFDALKYLKITVKETNNPVAAFQGISIIANFVLPFMPSKNTNKEAFKGVVEEYMPLFADNLYKHNFCYGAFTKLLYAWGYSDNKYQAYTLVPNGEAICSSQLKEGKIQPFLDRDFRVLYTKAKINAEMRAKKNVEK